MNPRRSTRSSNLGPVTQSPNLLCRGSCCCITHSGLLGAAPLHTHDLDRRIRLPLAFREISEVHGAAAVGDGFFAEDGDGAPRGGVIDVEVGGDAAAQCFDESVVFEEVAGAHLVVRTVVPDSSFEDATKVFRN